MLESNMEYIIIRRMRVACCLDRVTHTHSIRRTYSFSTLTMVTHPHNYVISISTLPVYFFVFVFTNCTVDEH